MKLILVAGLLVFCTRAQFPSAAAKTITVCEHQTMTISCGSSGEIHIKDARYGRQDGGKTCPHPSIRSRSYKCRAGSSERVLIDACEGKSRCHVVAKNGVFGDPCRGIFKYLRVEYSCIQPPHNVETVCEHQKMNIDCGYYEKIQIESASYGRRNGGTCRHASIRTNNCHAASSKKVVLGACEGKSQCHVAASNSVFGDPCRGTFKYLQVKYQCIPPPVKIITACEHHRMNIYCGKSKMIEIERASYGRTDNGKTCPHTSIKTHKCHARSSERVVFEACAGRSQCHIAASNSVFGDPCVGTFKYLQVEYRCLRI